MKEGLTLVVTKLMGVEIFTSDVSSHKISIAVLAIPKSRPRRE